MAANTGQSPSFAIFNRAIPSHNTAQHQSKANASRPLAAGPELDAGPPPSSCHIVTPSPSPRSPIPLSPAHLVTADPSPTRRVKRSAGPDMRRSYRLVPRRIRGGAGLPRRVDAPRPCRYDLPSPRHYPRVTSFRHVERLGRGLRIFEMARTTQPALARPRPSRTLRRPDRAQLVGPPSIPFTSNRCPCPCG